MNRDRVPAELFKATEGDVLRQVRDFLRIHGFFVTRNQQGLGNEKGKPDLEAVSPKGTHWWIEVKKPGGKLSDDQIKFRDKLLANKANFLVATCIEDVEDLVRR